MTPEGKVKAQVKALLKAYNVWYCMPMGHLYGKAGVPDFLCCVKGKFVAIETKSANGRLSHLQCLNRDLIQLSGGECLTIYPTDIDELKRKLTQWTGMEIS